MATRTTEQQQEANKLISEHYARATPKGLEIPAKNSVLWRYMDAAKLVGMLANKALPMTRVDMFEDRWEGFLDPSENLYHGFLANQHKESDSERFKQGEQLRKFYYGNCWHLSDIESDAMWKLYISGNEGLAIRTTYQSLICSLRDAPQEFLIGKVRYTKPSAGSSMLLTCMTKREPFTHEKEVRVIWHNAKAEQSLDNNDADTQPSTIELDCDFQQLVDEVYVSPKAGAWFAPAIRDLLKKYKLKDVKVSQSVLSGKPQWPK